MKHSLSPSPLLGVGVFVQEKVIYISGSVCWDSSRQTQGQMHGQPVNLWGAHCQ